MNAERDCTHTFEVYKKCSSDGRLQLYLEKRTFYDYLTHVDPIDGVIAFDRNSLSGQNVYLTLICTCRYGREDLDILGLTFQKDLLVFTKQVWPESSDFTLILAKRRGPRKHTCVSSKRRRYSSNTEQKSCNSSTIVAGTEDNIYFRPEDISSDHFVPSFHQSRLIARLGSQACPFRINLPSFTPSSVSFQPNGDETEKLCGISYEISAFIGKRLADPIPNSCVSMVIRKLTPGPALSQRPICSTRRTSSKMPMLSCDGPVKLTALLDKQLYYHEESVLVDVVIDNFTKFSVRKMIISILQLSELHMVTTGSYRTNVTKVKCRENLPVSPGVTGWKQTFSLLAGLTGQKRRRGLALEGQIKHQKQALASTTVFQTSENDEGYGQLMYSTFKDRWSSIKRPRAQQVLVISYLVRVKIWLGVSTLSVKVPFLLMHPPEETKDNSNSGLNNSIDPAYSKSNSDETQMCEVCKIPQGN